MQVYGRITGEVHGSGTLSGSLRSSGTIGGTLTIPQEIPVPTYTGEYVFTPTQSTQTIETAGLKVLEDFIINPIPQNYGLITWDGSTLTVS